MRPETKQLGIAGKKPSKRRRTTADQRKTQLFRLLQPGLTGKTTAANNNQKYDNDELLQAGMTFYQTKQDGGSTSDALIGALMASSPLGQNQHRAMSGAAVAAAIMAYATPGKH